jgi:hypothetical protein
MCGTLLFFQIPNTWFDMVQNREQNGVEGSEEEEEHKNKDNWPKTR